MWIQPPIISGTAGFTTINFSPDVELNVEVRNQNENLAGFVWSVNFRSKKKTIFGSVTSRHSKLLRGIVNIDVKIDTGISWSIL